MRIRPLIKHSFTTLAVALAILFGRTTVRAQTTRFTYQGSLTDSGAAANGNYDLQFALFDSLSGGTQVSSTQTVNTVAVSNGVFTVSLDFGASAFNGASRFLQISVRPAGSGSLTLLGPRQEMTSTPYAVRSLTASSADSVPASGVPAGSGNYIQNTSSMQSANFNISGTGTASAFSVATGFLFSFDQNLAIANHAGGKIELITNSFGRMTITSAGHVGIGTSVPTKLLHLQGMGSDFAGNGDLLVTGTGTVGAAMTFNSTATGGRTYSWISTANDADSGGGKLAAYDVTASAYRMVVDSAGKVGIGTTGPLDRLHVSGDLRVGVTGTNACLKNNNGGTIVGTCSSDVRFKRDLVPFAQVLDKVTRLQPKYYSWRAEEFPEKNFGPAREAGLVAHEVEQVLPELVSEDELGFKLVDYSKLPLMLVQAVKEQQALIEQQQGQIAELKKIVCRSHARAAVCK